MTATLTFLFNDTHIFEPDYVRGWVISDEYDTTYQYDPYKKTRCQEPPMRSEIIEWLDSHYEGEYTFEKYMKPLSTKRFTREFGTIEIMLDKPYGLHCHCTEEMAMHFRLKFG
jgi:hypothetical protein